MSEPAHRLAAIADDIAVLHEEIGDQADTAADACGDPQVAAACRGFVTTVQGMLDAVVADTRWLSGDVGPGPAA
ncbi:MAG TPA: hypothetical protein VHC49_00720 [Mycobacteriales bacterium]|nr:hypothetical protein [Mycobacteriales bacterium]